MRNPSPFVPRILPEPSHAMRCAANSQPCRTEARICAGSGGMANG